MKITRLTVLFLCILLGNAYAETVQTTRGPWEIESNSVVQGPTSLLPGEVMRNLENVTFTAFHVISANPHTERFINCKNLTFIDSNLYNTEIPADFTTIRTLTIHKRFYTDSGKNYEEVECGDNKTRTYEIVDTSVNVIDRDFPLLSSNQKDVIRAKYEEEGITLIEGGDNLELRTIKDTPNEKKYTHIKRRSIGGPAVIR